MENCHRFSFVEEEYPLVAGSKCSNSSSLQSSKAKQKLVTFGGCLCERKKRLQRAF